MPIYNVTIEKILRTSFDVEADDPDDISEKMPEFNDVFMFVDESCCTVEYDWAACDENGDDVIPWDN